jgi:hypothetical protein
MSSGGSVAQPCAMKMKKHNSDHLYWAGVAVVVVSILFVVLMIAKAM